MQSPPSAILFSIGHFNFHYYGLIMFFAILSGIFVIARIAKKYYADVDIEVLLDILPVIILSAILGARLYYVIMDFSYYSRYPLEVFAVWQGGLSIHGALLGGVFAGFILSKKIKFSFLKYADIFAFGLLIGQAIGRFGNYFNCEAFGKPCDLPFKLYIPESHRPLEYRDFEYFHPAFLYESIWNLLTFVILFYIFKKYKNLKQGSIFFLYLLFYSVGRFMIEFIRVDSVVNIRGIPVAQFVSFWVIVISLCFILFLNFSQKKSRN